jgi:hypothetical protein
MCIANRTRVLHEQLQIGARDLISKFLFMSPAPISACDALMARKRASRKALTGIVPPETISATRRMKRHLETLGGEAPGGDEPRLALSSYTTLG